MAAECDHEGEPIGNRGAPGSHDRQPAGEADADEAGTPSRTEPWFVRQPTDRILDEIGRAV
jgi:hypothetical protein